MQNSNNAYSLFRANKSIPLVYSEMFIIYIYIYIYKDVTNRH